MSKKGFKVINYWQNLLKEFQNEWNLNLKKFVHKQNW